MCDISRTFNMATFNCKGGSKTEFISLTVPSPSPTESKRLFYTSVSLLLSHIQGYHYHLSKFHIYALVYCIGKASPESHFAFFAFLFHGDGWMASLTQ